MTGICDPLFSKNKKFHLPNDSLQANVKHYLWFVDECQVSRFYIELINKYRRDKSAVNQSNLARVRGNFKRTIRQKRYIFEKDKTLIFFKSGKCERISENLEKATNLNTSNSISAEKICFYFQVFMF